MKDIFLITKSSNHQKFDTKDEAIAAASAEARNGRPIFVTQVVAVVEAAPISTPATARDPEERDHPPPPTPEPAVEEVETAAEIEGDVVGAA